MKAIPLLTIVTLLFFSCREEESIEPKVTISMLSDHVNEAQDNFKIEFVLNQKALEDIYFDYSVSGSAIYGEDYIFSLPNPIKIQKGYSKVIFELYVNDDSDFELDETIKIEIINASSLVNISSPIVDSLVIINDDKESMMIKLTWEKDESYEKWTDMDLALWGEQRTSPITYSAHGGSAFEKVNLYHSLVDGYYGLTYRYYEGEDNDLEFSIQFNNLAGQIYVVNKNGDVIKQTQDLIVYGTYTLANLNNTGYVNLEHIFTKEGANFTIPNWIYIPEEGSRSTKDRKEILLTIK